MNDTNRILSRPLLGMALSLALAAGSAHAQAPAHGGAALTQSQVKSLLSEQGYTKLDKLKFEDGLWKTEATSGDGKRGEVRVGPRGGRVYAEGAPSKLSASEVTAALTASGYTQVHDVHYEEGLWEAQARTSTGQRVELRADPGDGSVVSAQED
ncbi:PepSY domain-containing protein [Xanthomonas bundabergensis]|uniref:PepSY domain-containing protein n=1 Tax=Xanthomonas bundabergensis TaxID=3160842 RepID=UPI00351500CE